jgi:hypothetical protein
MNLHLIPVSILNLLRETSTLLVPMFYAYCSSFMKPITDLVDCALLTSSYHFFVLPKLNR